jgi:hypothetical protein
MMPWTAKPGKCMARATNGRFPGFVVSTTVRYPSFSIREKSGECFDVAACIADLMSDRPLQSEDAERGLGLLRCMERKDKLAFGMPRNIQLTPFFRDGLDVLEHWEALIEDLRGRLAVYSENR